MSVNFEPSEALRRERALDGKLEDAADIFRATMTECALVSIAISLKRLADAAGSMDGTMRAYPLDTHTNQV